MAFKFYKYSATGNDFIIVDNRQGTFTLDKAFWSSLCERRTGIGADGVLLVENHQTLDFSMRYLNADGGEVSMCGNGARSISHYCHHILKLKNEGHYFFMTKAGQHESWVRGNDVKIKLPGVRDLGAISLEGLIPCKRSLFVNTGVPHAVFEVENLDQINVQQLGSLIRYDKRFSEGTNANFYERKTSLKVKVRTYERGVEGETLACGTGAVATALCLKYFDQVVSVVEVETKGGKLSVELAPDLSWTSLEGSVVCHFSGETI